MKIILVNPPARRLEKESIVLPPLGLLYVGTSLMGAGFNVTLKDAFAEGINWQEFKEYMEKERPDIMGISGMSPTIDTCFKAIGIARPHTKYIILGGPHMSLYRQKTFEQCPDIDIGVVGEGEETALELMEALSQGRPLKGIGGVITKEFENEDRELIQDINTLPYPKRNMVPNTIYRYPLLRNRHVTTMFTSRGCPYHCSFCDKSIFGSQWRARTADNILGEIDEIVHCYMVSSIIFYDDLFTVNRERVLALCDGILRRGYRLDWKCEGRINLVDRELLKMMKRAGCSMIAYGVESGNQKGLDYLCKKTKPDEAKKAFKLTREAGIKTMAYFILGIPVETYQEELNTIKFAMELKPTYAQFSTLSPYYGTKIYEDAIKKGWYRELDAKNPLDKDLMRPAVISENWNEKKLQRILRTAHRRFYFRSSYILRQVLAVRSLYQLVNHLKSFLNLISWMRA